jgi:hypothetical protein
MFYVVVHALQAEAALSAVAAVRKRTEPRWSAGKPYCEAILCVLTQHSAHLHRKEI